MIGCDQAGARVARHILAADVVQDHIVAAEIQDQPLVRALAEGIAQRASAADDWRYLRDCCDLVRHSRTRELHVSFLAQMVFRQRDEFDHALVGLARVFSKSKNAVFVQDQPLDVGIFLKHLGGSFCQREARHDVGHETEAVVEGLRA